MTTPLPTFRYHEDPIATGSVVSSANACRRCGQQRGYIYVGPVYADQDLDDAFCPWCIADGSAAKTFDAEFTDAQGIGDYGSWDSVPAEVVEEVSRRTPGFSGWQQERWWTHCSDAAVFLGRAGWRELESKWAGAVASIKADVQMDGQDWRDYLSALDGWESPTAYVFRCRHCGQLGGYSDCD
jgi:uncharacterized protein CbrC (UPF0167 family)